MSRILLVDDDEALLEVLTMAFADAGHAVTTAIDGVDGLGAAARDRPDAIVSDVNMPRLDGFALCRKLRAQGDPVPILLLTSRDNEIDEALGLELGADDYIAKPFSTRILLARVTALLRRDALRRRDAPGPVARDAPGAVELRAGELVIDPERIEARFRGTSLALTLTEFRMLEAFARKPGIVLSRDRLLEIVRGDDSVVVERIIDTYVRRLRRKLEAIDPAFDAIETVVGAGYRFRAVRS
ncbi:response regulator transcription factor [Pendulispora albinea]|uniref:Response regulator transcription factor n=1 Tax=Pendulispora albinea TaxID=2741071 RepID=A0ABZ2LRM5_9BACT